MMRLRSGWSRSEKGGRLRDVWSSGSESSSELEQGSRFWRPRSLVSSVDLHLVVVLRRSRGRTAVSQESLDALVAPVSQRPPPGLALWAIDPVTSGQLMNNPVCYYNH